MSPPIGGRASDGSWDAADTIWLSSPRIGPPLRAGRQEAAPQPRRPCSVSAIQRRVGSKPTIVTGAAAVGALGGDDAVADAREGTARRSARRTGRAGPSRVVGELAEQRAERRRVDVGGRRRAVGQEGVGEGGQARRSGGAADDDQPAAAGDPAAQRRRAARSTGVAESVSCQTRRSSDAPGLDPGGQVGDGRARP